MKRFTILGWLALVQMIAGVTVAANAFAAPQALTLTPADMLAQTHSHAVIISFTGTYKTLSGTLNFDPVAKTCSFNVTFLVRSLTAPNALVRAQMMSKGFLDPLDYPNTFYQGVCQGNRLIGNLTLRGQTHPFDMDITYLGSPDRPDAIHAEGTINRYEWGVNGLRLTVSRNIRVTNDIALNGQSPTPLSEK